MPCRSGSLCSAPEFEPPEAWQPQTRAVGHAHVRRVTFRPHTLSSQQSAAPAKQFPQGQHMYSSTPVATQGSGHATPPSTQKKQPAAAAQPLAVQAEAHPAFCGSYATLRCEARDPAVRALLHQQAMAVVDLALRDLTSASNGCALATPNAAAGKCGRPHSAGTDLQHKAEATDGTEAEASRLQRRLSAADAKANANRVVAHAQAEADLVVGHEGAHVQVPPHMLQQWEQVCAVQLTWTGGSTQLVCTYEVPSGLHYTVKAHGCSDRTQRAETV